MDRFSPDGAVSARRTQCMDPRAQGRRRSLAGAFVVGLVGAACGGDGVVGVVANVDGRLCDAESHAPLANYSFEVLHEGGREIATTDASGDYAVSVRPGPVRIIKEGVELAGDVAASGRLAILDDACTTGAVRGCVCGSAQPDVDVRLVGPGRNEVLSLSPDSACFLANPLPPGRYDILWGEQSAPAVVDAGAVLELPADAFPCAEPEVPPSPGVLGGCFCDQEAGEWLSGARVTIRDDGDEFFTAQTDADGCFQRELDPGRYTVEVERNGVKLTRTASVTEDGQTYIPGPLSCELPPEMECTTSPGRATNAECCLPTLACAAGQVQSGTGCACPIETVPAASGGDDVLCVDAGSVSGGFNVEIKWSAPVDLDLLVVRRDDATNGPGARPYAQAADFCAADACTWDSCLSQRGGIDWDASGSLSEPDGFLSGDDRGSEDGGLERFTVLAGAGSVYHVAVHYPAGQPGPETVDLEGAIWGFRSPSIGYYPVRSLDHTVRKGEYFYLYQLHGNNGLLSWIYQPAGFPDAPRTGTLDCLAKTNVCQ